MTNDLNHDPLRDLIHQSLVSDKLTPSAELRTKLEQRLDDEIVVSPAKPQPPQAKPRRRIVRAWHMALVVTAVLAVMVYLSLPERLQQQISLRVGVPVDARQSDRDWRLAVTASESVSGKSKRFDNEGLAEFEDTATVHNRRVRPIEDNYSSATDKVSRDPSSLGTRGAMGIEGQNAPRLQQGQLISGGSELATQTKPVAGRYGLEDESSPKPNSTVGPQQLTQALRGDREFSNRSVGGVAITPDGDTAHQWSAITKGRTKFESADTPVTINGKTYRPVPGVNDPTDPTATTKPQSIQGYAGFPADEFRGIEEAKVELASEQAARRAALATLTTRLSTVATDGEKTQELAKLTKEVKELGDLIATNEARADYLRRLESGSGSEQYDAISDNPFLPVKDAPLSTFSIDVDTASYANVRRFLTQGQVPPADAVRIEELLNYFSYDYPAPKGDEPFSVNMETAPCPWREEHLLLRVGLKGKEVHKAERPASNLVFLVDTSGSMSDEDKLPLVKQSLSMLTRELGERDRITIVTYAGEAGLKLAPTNGGDHGTITSVINSLNSNGSTHGSAGIQMAYAKARESFIKEGTNRVILCTDGDLNVGITQDDQLVDLISKEAKTGVFLTVLGFGQGNLKDSKMEKLADHGNGIYAYIDGVREAKKVLVDQMSGSLTTIAKDVKIQIEFNPSQVRGYRLIGYENRVLAAKDFNDDTKDAGEIGAGHTVTALYELVPAGAVEPKPVLDDLKYQGTGVRGQGSEGDEKAEGDADGKPDVRVYPITKVDPKDVLKVVQNRFADQPQVRIAVDPKTGSLIAHAIPSQHATIKALINETVKGDVQKELLTLKLRYKKPDGDVSTKIEYPLSEKGTRFTNATPDFRFAASVAAFGMILRDSPYRGAVNMAGVGEIAASSLGDDVRGYRAEFLDLVRRAEKLGKR